MVVAFPSFLSPKPETTITINPDTTFRHVCSLCTSQVQEVCGQSEVTYNTNLNCLLPVRLCSALRGHYTITRLTAHFSVCVLMFDLVIHKFLKSLVIHDTKCPHRDQVSLNNTTQAEWVRVHWMQQGSNSEIYDIFGELPLWQENWKMMGSKARHCVGSFRNGVGADSYVTVMVRHGGSSAGSYLTDPTSPISSHCAVIILFKSVPVHQLSWLALLKDKHCEFTTLLHIVLLHFVQTIYITHQFLNQGLDGSGVECHPCSCLNVFVFVVLGLSGVLRKIPFIRNVQIQCVQSIWLVLCKFTVCGFTVLQARWQKF